MIIVHKRKSDLSGKLITDLEMFKEEYLIVKDYGDSISIRIPTIDYQGKLKKTYIHKPKEGFRAISLTSEIPSGKYKLNEDSNEDELIIDYGDNI